MSAFHKKQPPTIPSGVHRIDTSENKDTEKYRYFHILKSLLDDVDCIATDSDLELNIDLHEILPPEISDNDNKLMLNSEETTVISAEKDMYLYALERISDEELMVTAPDEIGKDSDDKIGKLLGYLSKVRKGECPPVETGGQIKQKTPLSRKKGKGKMTKRRKRKTKRNKSRRKRK